MTDETVHVHITIDADIPVVFLTNMFDAVKNTTPLGAGAFTFEVESR